MNILICYMYFSDLYLINHVFCNIDHSFKYEIIQGQPRGNLYGPGPYRPGKQGSGHVGGLLSRVGTEPGLGGALVPIS